MTDLLKKLDGLRDPTKPVIFRGQADSVWRLEPSIDRNVKPRTDYGKRLEIERSIVERFRKEADHLLGQSELEYLKERRPGDLISPQTVLQHFGAPTRLLDWTRSPFVAAFFAAIDLPHKNGAVWWYGEQALHEAVRQHRVKHRIPDPAGPEFSHEKALYSKKSPRFIMPVYLSISFQRAEAQQGLFTLASRLGELHDELFEELLTGDDFGRIEFPSSVKPDLLMALKARNITAPSLHHVGADRLGFQLAADFARRCERP